MKKPEIFQIIILNNNLLTSNILQIVNLYLYFDVIKIIDLHSRVNLIDLESTISKLKSEHTISNTKKLVVYYLNIIFKPLEINLENEGLVAIFKKEDIIYKIPEKFRLIARKHLEKLLETIRCIDIKMLINKISNENIKISRQTRDQITQIVFYEFKYKEYELQSLFDKLKVKSWRFTNSDIVVYGDDDDCIFFKSIEKLYNEIPDLPSFEIFKEKLVYLH